MAWRRCGVSSTLFIVRHAERAGGADALSPAGVERAEALSRLLRPASIVAVYHSDTQRTRDTAAPLARALGVTAGERPAANTAALIAEILDEHRGENTLIIGHSNTVPQIIREAGGPALPNLAETEFHRLFMLETCSCFPSRTRLTELHYGAPPP